MSRLFAVVVLLGSLGLGQARAQALIDKLEIDESHPGEFRASLVVSGLPKSQHEYKLTLNGTVGRPGNELLGQFDKLPNGEGYFDFQDVRSNNNGMIRESIKQRLPRGRYLVKFSVKDPADNWKIVAKKEPISFEIK